MSLQPAGVQDWTAATLNRPLTTGDRLWSDEDSRAELDLGTAAIRLGSYTGFAFLNLNDRSVQMQLSAGALIVSVRDIQNGESYEVDTPNIALSLQQPGVYRVEVNDQGTATAVAVSQGVAQAAGGGQTVPITSQQVVTFSGGETLAWQTRTLGLPDEFDDWSAGRDRAAAESASRGYVANDVPGREDLDSNGQWQQTPEYGYVWVPAPTVLAADWAPYRYGQWVWVTPWGWTWVDAAHWGYAPFHYGRWVVWNNSWCWVPAPKHGPAVRAVYAPALVAWVGAPAAGNVAIGSTVGWFPLGPREVYVPAYRASSEYVRSVNVTNTTVINNLYITNIYQNNTTPQHYLNEIP
ncbi:MAG: FecR protein, partial [Gammaproteobacteria bacterium]|nr:FecR protein [Gammaproteobacteria bacterium]